MNAVTRLTINLLFLTSGEISSEKLYVCLDETEIRSRRKNIGAEKENINAVVLYPLKGDIGYFILSPTHNNKSGG